VMAPPANVESIEICALSGMRPSTFCPSVQKEFLAADDKPRFCSWHRDGYVDLPPEYRLSTSRPGPAGSRRYSLKIASPPDGATYLIDPTLRREFQTLRLRAHADSRVVWQIDGTPVAVEWPLVPGRHTVTAMDARGARDSVEITVK
jgi:penicillin-binding protein